MKRILLLALVALLAGTAYAETRDVNPTILDMFDQSFAPYTETPDPVPGANYVPYFIDEGASDGAVANDSPAMYTGAAIGDLAFLVVESDGTNVPTVAGWTALSCSGVQDAGVSELNVFYQVLASATPAREVAINGGDHIVHWTFGIRLGSFDAASPLETGCHSASLGITATPTSTAITTANDNSFVVTVFSTDRDANGSNWVSSLATTGTTYAPFLGTAASVTGINGYIKNTGNGGGVMVIGGVQETAGTTGVVSGVATSATHIVLTFAINGEQS